MKVIWTTKAKKQVQKTAGYIRREFGSTTVSEFKQTIRETDRLLVGNPYMGRVEPFLEELPQMYRSYVITQVNKIVYRIDDDKIVIVAFWDMRREPSSLVNEIKKS